MLFSIAFLLVLGYYLKINAGRYYQAEPVRKNIAVSAQTVTRSIEAIDKAFKSIDVQATLMKDMLTENMLSTGKKEVGSFNQRLQESTEQIKQLFEATKALKETRQNLEHNRQQLLNLRGRV
jgi:DNA repair exonuclease SbcCD ATPase subunit